MTGTAHHLEINPRIPQRLKRLEELANNLWYSWDGPTRALFASLSRPLWESTDRNPKALLKLVDQKELDTAAENPVFLQNLDQVLSAYDSYFDRTAVGHADRQSFKQDNNLIAYFCAEFGFHESLPIYSGGLGILAGDHCKAASDMALPFIGVGLLYRQGYFHQTLDANGQQHAIYSDSDFENLPVSPLHDADNKEVRISIDLSGRTVWAKVWRMQVGHVRILLLDTWLPENSELDRDITHRLYGGERSHRIEQEILLGVGGVRALAALGLKPTVWHINEGHAAFLVFERIRGLLARGLPFAAALEAVAASVVFTTHTAVAAGHDHFSEEMIQSYFLHWREELGDACEHLLALGMEPDKPEFNMTALGIRGSRHQNGVSRIHGYVSAQICRHFWPQIATTENPMDFVTNGAHLPTFLSPEWNDIFDQYLGIGWQQRQTELSSWEGIDSIPDQTFWNVRQLLKSKLLFLVRELVRKQHERNQGSPSHLPRLLKFVDPDKPKVLTIGFARRFATYKRAALLFHDPARLKEIICATDRPVLFLFAGKAHPADHPAQEIIRHIAELSRRPEFEGRILLLEGYDLHLSRRLVAGVDVWLNNPIYPLEASGTSGMKAAMNGAINLSILDGWWGEGYDDTGKVPNGWAIKPASSHLGDEHRDAEEARTLYELLQDQVIPSYYRTGPLGYSPQWVAMSKRSIATIAPRFNAIRMVDDYVQKFYAPAARQGHRLATDDYAPARTLADWKSAVHAAWTGVRLRRLATPSGRIQFGQAVRIEIAIQLNGLKPQDVRVEAHVLRSAPGHPESSPQLFTLDFNGTTESGESCFATDLNLEQCGRIEYRIRAFPFHPLLSHPFELGLMAWL